MPIPPTDWTDRDVDEHWEKGHQVIGEEVLSLKVDKNPHIRIAACAQRIVRHFGEIARYDLEVLLGSFDFMIHDHDLIALTDGAWIPGLKTMPSEIRAKRIAGSQGKAHDPKRVRIWMKLANQILVNPWNVVDPPETRKTSSASRQSLKQRFLIFKRDNYRCRLCGVAAKDGEHVRLEVDHITARSKGGSNDDSNLWTLCFDCNRGKRTDEL